MQDLRKQITDTIIACMEKEGGVPPWRQSWSSGCLHFNASSGQAYKGINQVILMVKGQEYGDARWLTYKQAEHMGVQVRKGEHGTQVVKMVEVRRSRTDQIEPSDDDVLAEGDSRALVMKAYTVFNASQIDGMAPMSPLRRPDMMM